MKNAIQKELEQLFYGTSNYYSLQCPSTVPVYLTDGTYHLAEKYGMFWLMDAIASYIPSIKDTFAVAILSTKDGMGQLTIQDDVPPNKIYASQHIGHIDSDVGTIKLYIEFGSVGDKEAWVILVPTEH